MKCILHGTFQEAPPGQNGRHFADDTFIGNFLKEKFCILIKLSVKFVSEGPINNNSVWV